MENREEVIGVAKRGIRTIFLGWSNIIFWLVLVFLTIKLFIGLLGRGTENGTGIAGLLVIIVVVLFELLFVYMGYYLLKVSQNIYYYEDGFKIGKNGRKILYKNLKYKIAPGQMPNKMMLMYFKDESENKWKRIPVMNYAQDAFSEFQDGAVRQNVPDMLERIERGETIEFNFHFSKMYAWAGKKVLDGNTKLKINKDAFILDDEVYNWSEYKFVSQYAGLVVIFDKNEKRVAVLQQKYLVDQPNIVSSLVNILGGN